MVREKARGKWAVQPFAHPFNYFREGPMPQVELTDDRLIVQVEGVDKILAFKSRIECPIEHVEGVALGVPPDVKERFNKSLRLPGSYMPPIIIAGTYIYRNEGHWERQFWDRHHADRVITIRLAHEDYRSVVIEVDDPAGTVAAIRAAIGRSGGAPP